MCISVQVLTCPSQRSLHKDTATEEQKAAFKIEYQKKSRDNARTPMQWDDSAHGGFTTAKEPWMRVNDNYKTVNAASQVDDENSVYHCYRQVLKARKAHKDIFVYGDWALVDEANTAVFAYKRTGEDGKAALVACNFTDKAVEWNAGTPIKEILVSPAGQTLDKIGSGSITLGPCEGIAVLL